MKDVRQRLQNMTVATTMTVGILVSGAAIVSAHAQDATPRDTAACTLAPLDLPLFGGTPAAAFMATPAVAAVDSTHLETVDAETEGTVREAVANLVACVNTGEPRRAYAIFTPAYLAETYGDPTRAYLPAFERSLDALPQPLTDPFAIETLTIEGKTSDGRVVIALTVSDGKASWPARLVLREIDGTWLIDAVIT